jgi:hypothetical protein
VPRADRAGLELAILGKLGIWASVHFKLGLPPILGRATRIPAPAVSVISSSGFLVGEFHKACFCGAGVPQNQWEAFPFSIPLPQNNPSLSISPNQVIS